MSNKSVELLRELQKSVVTVLSFPDLADVKDAKDPTAGPRLGVSI